MISRMPYSCSNGGWVILAGHILYLGFSLMQFLFRWGSFEPCEGYEDQRDCPIYEQFDWHKPLRTALFALIAVAIGFVVILLYSGLAREPQADLAREARLYTSLAHLGGAWSQVPKCL